MSFTHVENSVRNILTVKATPSDRMVSLRRISMFIVAGYCHSTFREYHLPLLLNQFGRVQAFCNSLIDATCHILP